MIQDDLRRYTFRVCFLPVCAIACCSNLLAADGLIRSKKPDRGTYQSPILGGTQGQAANSAGQTKRNNHEDANQLVDTPILDLHSKLKPLDVVPPLDALPDPIMQVGHSESTAASDESVSNAVQSVGYEHVSSVENCSCESCRGSAVFTPMTVVGEPIYDASCDGLSCGSPGCDSHGYGSFGQRSHTPHRWFGSIELLLMFRSGDLLPPLVTTGPADDPDTAGQLGQDGTVVLAGGGVELKDITGGGRLTIGTWLDGCKDRSLVARGWFAGEKSYGFTGNQDTNAVLTRPFFNVTDGETPAQDTQLIVFPNRTSGVVSVSADNNVYGADLSIRQLAYKDLGGTIDFLYGYQYMGMSNSLSIASRSTSLNDDFAPVGSVLAVADSFDIQNDFHGAQLGIASNYREGCWSFSSLAKIGFGGIRRKTLLRGLTMTSIDGNNATDPNGLLVRSTNAGKRIDNTFGWVPELDLTLGWQKYPAFDVTCGYNLIVMTDARQLADVIDPQLASNLAANPIGAQRPTPVFRDGTFYVHGIHFGINYIY